MDKNDVETLDELLTDADELKQVLRVHLVDNEVYDLSGFGISQDFDEEYPHCYTTVVQPVTISEKKRQFAAGQALMIHLDDIVEVRDAATGKVLFPS